MQPTRHHVLRCLRYAAIGMAILGVLLVAFRIHLHVPMGGDHGHGSHAELGVGCSELLEDPSLPDAPMPCDPDGCGHCHCGAAAALVALVPTRPLLVESAARSSVIRPLVQSEHPDRRSYPPDPPPVKPG